MNLLGLFKSFITVERMTGRDRNGAKQYAPPKVYRAHVMGRAMGLIRREGELITSRVEALVATTDQIGLEDRVTLPPGNFPQQPPILFVEVVSDDRGNPQYTHVRA